MAFIFHCIKAPFGIIKSTRGPSAFGFIYSVYLFKEFFKTLMNLIQA